MLTFEELEEMRRKHGFTRAQIYTRAGVDKNTWSRLSRRPNNCTANTLNKLKAALDGLIAEESCRADHLSSAPAYSFDGAQS